MTYRERRENRAERRRDWADGREQKADTAWQKSRDAVDGIPLGQPILVGHHSERGHRKALATSDRQARKTIEHLDMAKHHAQAAKTIERQLDQSIYDDDPDAIERLETKIAGIEERRERIKDLNRRIRKGESLDDLGLTSREIDDLAMCAAYSTRKPVTFPPYVLQNLGGNINRAKNRLAGLIEAQAD